MDIRRCKRKDYWKLFIDEYIEYVQFYNPELKKEKLEERIKTFKASFDFYLSTRPYRLEVFEELILKNIKSKVFRVLKKEGEEIESHEVVSLILKDAFTKEIYPKRRWVLFLERYLTIWCTIITIICTILNIYIYLTTGLNLN